MDIAVPQSITSCEKWSFMTLPKLNYTIINKNTAKCQNEVGFQDTHVSILCQIVFGKVSLTRVTNLALEIHHHSAKDDSSGCKQTGQHLRGSHIGGGNTPMRHLGKSLDEITAIGVLVLNVQVSFALSCIFVHALANFEDIVLVLLIIIVLVVLIVGFGARDAIGRNEGFAGVWELLAVVEFLVHAVRGGEGASFFHENAEENFLPSLGAVRTDEEFLVCIAVSIVLVIGILVLLVAVVVVVECVLVDFEATALQCFLKVELVLVIVIVVVIVVVDAIIKTSIHITIVLAAVPIVVVVIVVVFTVAALPNTLAVVFLSAQLGLGVGIHEGGHVDDIIGSVLAGRARVRGAQLEMHETLFVDTVVSCTIVVVLVVIVISIEESTVVIMSGSALLEFDGISRNPGHVVVIIIVVELTSLREDHGAEFGVCCNIACAHKVDSGFVIEG